MPEKNDPHPKPRVREDLLEASFALIREQGYSRTSVNELCAAAGVSKGAFFHHFQKTYWPWPRWTGWSEVSMAFFRQRPTTNTATHWIESSVISTSAEDF